jgi:hypothetical protein
VSGSWYLIVVLVTDLLGGPGPVTFIAVRRGRDPSPELTENAVAPCCVGHDCQG